MGFILGLIVIAEEYKIVKILVAHLEEFNDDTQIIFVFGFGFLQPFFGVQFKEVIEQFAIKFVSHYDFECIVVVLLSIEEFFEFAVETFQILFIWVVNTDDWHISANLVIILIFAYFVIVDIFMIL